MLISGTKYQPIITDVAMLRDKGIQHTECVVQVEWNRPCENTLLFKIGVWF